VIVPPDLSGVTGVVGVGIDVVDVDRFRLVLARTPRFESRVFTSAERELAAARSDPTEFLAARFAAKESVLKVLACGIFDLPLQEIAVRGGGDEPPSLDLGPAVTAVAVATGISHWVLSLSHSGGVAAAIAVGLA
jgi:holo-[acyl-carrier protein] synthase